MLEISVAAGAAGPVMTLAGEADLTNAAALGEALAAQVSGGTRHLTVDLSGLRFADSASVRELVLAGRALHERGGVLVLVRPQPGVARVLTMMGVDQAITIRAGTGTGADPDQRAGDRGGARYHAQAGPAQGEEDEPDA
jgi:anti-sigma B factor antagonist